MHRGLVAVCVVAVGAAGCASQQKTENGAAQPVSTQQRITNNAWFDLANCYPQQLEVPKPVTNESLVGYLVSARPQLNECFVDPKNRGPAPTTQASIEATVTDQGVTYNVTGDNVTPEGKACVENALKARTGLEPLPQGAAPVTGTIQFQHNVGQSPAVTMGGNEANEAVGAVRLALPGWCECFEPWKNAPPRSMSAKVTLVKASPTPTSVVFEGQPETPEAGSVQQCLNTKITSLQIPHTSEQLTIPVVFNLIHSGVAELLPTDRPELQILQLDALRAQSSSNVAIALGARGSAQKNWADMVARYQANNKAFTLKQLQEGCADLLAADDALLAALEKQKENEQRTLEFVQAQAATDPAWNEAVAAAQKQLEGANTEIENTKKLRAEDAQGCPKVRY